VTDVRNGLGTTDIRFDRGMMGKTQMLAFRRVGGKVAVISKTRVSVPPAARRRSKVG